MSRSTKRVPNWSYAAASRTLPYIRLVLRDLREGFVAIWHLYKLAGCDVNHPAYGEQIRLLGDEARAILEEFDRLGVIPYQSPLRGIALFPFLVQDDQGGTPREAYFVFRDSRFEADAYILADALCEHNDLHGYERPLPAAWKEPGAVPILEREVRG